MAAEPTRAPATALDRLIDRLPDAERPAVTVPGRAAVSYRRLRELVAERAALLADRVPSGTVLGVGLSDPAGLLAWSLAALRRGHAVYLTQPDLPPGEADETARHERALAVVADDPDGSDGSDGTAAGELRLLEEPDPARDVPPAVHFHTSGTSGVRKAAVHPADALAAEVAAVLDRIGYRAGTTVLCAAPLAHAYGFVMGGLAVLAAGAHVVVARPLTGGQFGAVLHRWSPDTVVSVPALYDLWCAGATARAATVAPPRLCISAGAPLSAGTADRFAAVWGVNVSQQYGSSECGAVSVNLPGGGGARCVGAPYPGVRVTAGTAQRPAPVVVRSGHAASGYVGGAQLRLPVDPFTDDGVLTGDLGWLDGAGRLHLTGRATDAINVHGRKADPYRIEEVLRDADHVAEAAVVGVDTDGGDQWIAAFVTIRAGAAAPPTEAQLFAHCVRSLAPHQVPRRFFRLERIPRTVTGKPRLAELAALARAGGPGSGSS